MTLTLFRSSLATVPFAAALLLSSFALKAASLTSEARCFAPGNRDVGTTSCSATGFYAGLPITLQGRHTATGGSSVSYQVSGNQFQWDQRAVASAAGGLASVQVDTTLSAVLQTEGAVRAGFATGPFLIQNHGAQPSVFFPGYANRLEFGLGAGAPPIPITLGGLFSFTSAIHIQPFDGEGDASIVGRIRFFEADGVTPVAVSEVTAAPEPGSLVLAAPALAGLWFLRRKKSA